MAAKCHGRARAARCLLATIGAWAVVADGPFSRRRRRVARLADLEGEGLGHIRVPRVVAVANGIRRLGRAAPAQHDGARRAARGLAIGKRAGTRTAKQSERARFVGLLPGVLVLCIVSVGDATCPYCFGNIGSCMYDAERKCPAADLPVQNAGLVANVAAVVATGVSLTLTDVIAPRFLRMFSKAHLSALLQLLRRPPSGTIFEIKVNTKLTDILQAISNGLVTMEHAAIVYAGFIDDEADDSRRAALRETYKLLTSTKDFKAFADLVGFLAQVSASYKADIPAFHVGLIELLEKHYADLAKKPFFPGLITYMASGPVCCMVWQGMLWYRVA